MIAKSLREFEFSELPWVCGCVGSLWELNSELPCSDGNVGPLRELVSDFVGCKYGLGCQGVCSTL